MKTNMPVQSIPPVPSRNFKSTAAALLSCAALAALAPATASAQSVWSSEHGDFGIGYDAGALDPHVHLHAGAVVNGSPLGADAEFAPGDILAYIPSSKGAARAADPAWDFIGVSAGQTVWTFPATEDPTLPFIGFGAEELDPLDWTTSFTITLTGLSGSGVLAGGHFSAYTIDSFDNPDLIAISSFGGISGADVITLAAGGHTHYNLAFTQQGIYEATFLIQGIHAVDGPKSATATYTFGVAAIPEPSSAAALAGFGALGLVALRRRRRR
jgi:surface-anchored protein